MMILSFNDFDELEAHKKYKQLNFPKFNLNQIDNILKNKYNAEEVDVQLFPELQNDPYFNSSHVTKCYAIHDPEVLKNLFSEEEKKDHLEFMRLNGVLNKKVDHSVVEDRLHAIGQGSLLYIFFQSPDGTYLGSFLSTHGQCEKISHELIVFKGIDPENCVIGNVDYKLYLFSLVKAGYLDM